MTPRATRGRPVLPCRLRAAAAVRPRSTGTSSFCTGKQPRRMALKHSTDGTGESRGRAARRVWRMRFASLCFSGNVKAPRELPRALPDSLARNILKLFSSLNYVYHLRQEKLGGRSTPPPAITWVGVSACTGTGRRGARPRAASLAQNHPPQNDAGASGSFCSSAGCIGEGASETTSSLFR